MSDDSSVTAHVVEGSSFTYRQGKPTALPVESAPAAGTAVSDDARSGHISIASRVTAKTAPSPLINQNLHPEGSRKTRKKSKKIRALSTSSAKSGIASALAKGGIHLASPTNGDHLMSSAQSSHSKSGPTNRSPFLVRGNGADDASVAHADGDEDAYDDDDDDDDDDTDSDGDGHLPVTGFAVASNKRQADFRGMFSSVDEGDYLIEGEHTDTKWDLAHVCRQTMAVRCRRIFWYKGGYLCPRITCASMPTSSDGSPMSACPAQSPRDADAPQVVVAFTDIKQIEKKTTALVIPNAIGVSTATAKVSRALPRKSMLKKGSTPLHRSSPATQPTTS